MAFYKCIKVRNVFKVFRSLQFTDSYFCPERICFTAFYKSHIPQETTLPIWSIAFLYLSEAAVCVIAAITPFLCSSIHPFLLLFSFFFSHRLCGESLYGKIAPLCDPLIGRPVRRHAGSFRSDEPPVHGETNERITRAPHSLMTKRKSRGMKSSLCLISK